MGNGLPTLVSETVKEAPGVAMIDTVGKWVKREKIEREEEVEVDCESVENGLEVGNRSEIEGVRRRSTMAIPSIQPKLPNYVQHT